MLYEAQLSRYRTPPGEAAAGSGSYRPEHNDLDHIAHEARDTGALSEPLADSVLQYSLGQLKPNAKYKRGIVQALETEPYPNELAQLLGGNSEGLQQSSSVPVVNPERDSLPVTFDEEASNAPVLYTASTSDWSRGVIFPMEQGNPYDWLQLNPNGFLQPFSSYDESFDLECNI